MSTPATGWTVCSSVHTRMHMTFIIFLLLYYFIIILFIFFIAQLCNLWRHRFGTTCCGSAHAARATTAPGSRHHVGWGEGWSCSWSAGGEGGGRGVMARQGLMRMSPHKWHSNGALHWGMNVFLASMICDDDVSLVGQHHRHSDTCTIYNI